MNITPSADSNIKNVCIAKRPTLCWVSFFNPTYREHKRVGWVEVEDNEIARLIISTITGEDVAELEFLPLERTLEVEQRSFAVFRLDFSAKIRDREGDYKNVIIEIQKAKLAADIMRFRRYLGRQYESKDNVYTIEEKGTRIKKALDEKDKELDEKDKIVEELKKNI